MLAHMCMKSSCTQTHSTPHSQEGCWSVGPDTHLRALLGLGMLSQHSQCHARCREVYLLVLGILSSKQGWEMLSCSLEYPHHSPHAS